IPYFGNNYTKKKNTNTSKTTAYRTLLQLDGCWKWRGQQVKVHSIQLKGSQRVHADFYWIFLSSMQRKIAPLSIVQSMKDEIVATLLLQF
ncbi:MAG: hypothetical protein WCR45_09620, partial [Bacteroidaceae bacterium]